MAVELFNDMGVFLLVIALSPRDIKSFSLLCNAPVSTTTLDQTGHEE
jgi:hypothetical protein